MQLIINGIDATGEWFIDGIAAFINDPLGELKVVGYETLHLPRSLFFLPDTAIIQPASNLISEFQYAYGNYGSYGVGRVLGRDAGPALLVAGTGYVGKGVVGVVGGSGILRPAVPNTPIRTTLTNSAGMPISRNGVTPIGAAYQSHVRREPTWLTGPHTGNARINTEHGLRSLNEIFDNPSTTHTVRTVLLDGKPVEALEVRTSSGAGALWTSDGSRFIMILEEYTPRPKQ